MTLAGWRGGAKGRGAAGAGLLKLARMEATSACVAEDPAILPGVVEAPGRTGLLRLASKEATSVGEVPAVLPGVVEVSGRALMPLTVYLLLVAPGVPSSTIVAGVRLLSGE